ncbi:hypothetical protein SELMODRAFT_412841 [Selaginella moellendorffii]|uniref:Uncharacterized protein n=1 Tax=Selaginella moellendorffii TaxID=88036 RepID=D8RMH5_SELML|nr:hypothetical protein SELMODRAFT_412841 [Selaginella moellendorffii]
MVRRDAAIYLRFPPRDTGDHTAGSIVVGEPAGRAGRALDFSKGRYLDLDTGITATNLLLPTVLETCVGSKTAQLYVLRWKLPSRRRGGCCRDRYLNDVLVIYQSVIPVLLADGVIPPALSFHAAVHEGNHLCLFGAGSSGFCKNLYALDLIKRKWSRYPDQGPALVPAARFATAVTGNQCYVVGGATKETMLLNMESLEWTVVCRLATEFSVFLLKTMKSYPVLPHPMGKCQVRSVDGSLLELFDIPDAGEQALKITDRLWTKVGNGGVLVRDGCPLERDDAIFPGDELTFHPNDFVGIRDSIHRLVCEVRLMALGSCQLVLAAAKIEVIRGEGWLEPRAEIESQAFAGWNSRRQGDTMEYLVEGAKVGDVVILEHDIITGYYIKEEISEVDIWRALVMLLGVNIRCHTLKPWMVITDLKDEWHFAWMDWPRMYVCEAWSRSQGLGILCDLCHDYNLVTSLQEGFLSTLPSVFTRACPGFKWHVNEETRVMFAPRPPAFRR